MDRIGRYKAEKDRTFRPGMDRIGRYMDRIGRYEGPLECATRHGVGPAGDLDSPDWSDTDERGLLGVGTVVVERDRRNGGFEKGLRSTVDELERRPLRIWTAIEDGGFAKRLRPMADELEKRDRGPRLIVSSDRDGEPKQIDRDGQGLPGSREMYRRDGQELPESSETYRVGGPRLRLRPRLRPVIDRDGRELSDLSEMLRPRLRLRPIIDRDGRGLSDLSEMLKTLMRPRIERDFESLDFEVLDFEGTTEVAPALGGEVSALGGEEDDLRSVPDPGRKRGLGRRRRRRRGDRSEPEGNDSDLDDPTRKDETRDRNRRRDAGSSRDPPRRIESRRRERPNMSFPPRPRGGGPAACEEIAQKRKRGLTRREGPRSTR